MATLQLFFAQGTQVGTNENIEAKILLERISVGSPDASRPEERPARDWAYRNTFLAWPSVGSGQFNAFSNYTRSKARVSRGSFPVSS